MQFKVVILVIMDTNGWNLKMKPYTTTILQKKLLTSFFKGFEIKGWINHFMAWVIDSKYRTIKRLDKFLDEQLQNPSIEIDNIAKTLYHKDPDVCIIKILKFVLENYKYITDQENYGIVEYWNTAENILKLKGDDCDGLNSLIYILARLCNIPSEFIYCVIGNVSQGKHFYCIYYSSKYDKIVSIDATYYPSLRSVKNRPKFKIGEYQYTKIDYLFSDNFIFKPKMEE